MLAADDTSALLQTAAGHADLGVVGPSMSGIAPLLRGGATSPSRPHARLVRNRHEVWVEGLDSRDGAAQAAQVPAGVVIQNARMQAIYRDVAQAARGRLPALVLGETGTGKELIARAVHRESDRREQPFVAINCAAIAPTLLESTLFGHERGAFTGAIARNIGVFERANRGVLFLDEIGDLGLNAQVALLRAIETRRICRVGASAEVPIDVLLVAATHCDLEAMVEKRTFRKDLYFRLNGIQFELPPLRERTDEIAPLAHLFLADAQREWGACARSFTPEAMQVLQRCAWPGNVRQLRSAVERAALLATADAIGVGDLPDHVTADITQAAPPARATTELGLKQQLQRHERLLIDEALRRAGGNRQAAAELLRIPLRTLFRKLRGRGTGPSRRSAT